MRKQLHHFHRPAQLLFRNVHRCFLISSSPFFHTHCQSSLEAASPSPSPPTRRQRLKGIKRHHQWWNHYFRHENLPVRSVHQKHFIVTQFVPNRQKHERGDFSKRLHQEQPSGAGPNKPQHLTALVNGSATEVTNRWANNDGTQNTNRWASNNGTQNTHTWEKKASQNKTNMPTTPTTIPTTHAHTIIATASPDTLAATQTRDANNPYDDLIMAFLTSKRQFGKRAVDRNRARRRVKEAARKICLNQFDSSFWYVVVCKRQVQEATHEELCESFETIRDRFAKKDEQ